MGAGRHRVGGVDGSKLGSRRCDEMGWRGRGTRASGWRVRAAGGRATSWEEVCWREGGWGGRVHGESDSQATRLVTDEFSEN